MLLKKLLAELLLVVTKVTVSYSQLLSSPLLLLLLPPQDLQLLQKSLFTTRCTSHGLSKS